MLRNGLPFLASLQLAIVTASQFSKVSVQFFGESGCPYCRKFVAESLNMTLEAEGVAAIIDFEFFPWGNAYFVTKTCGGAGAYDPTARKCYNNACGRDASSRPADCFEGPPRCQHGAAECLGNRYLACAEKVAHKESSVYMPFVTCLEANYDATQGGNDWWAQLAMRCNASGALDASQVIACASVSSPDGKAAVAEQAMMTPVHPAVPYVLVAGQPLDDSSQLLKTVCAAYRGTRPPACLHTEEVVVLWS